MGIDISLELFTEPFGARRGGSIPTEGDARRVEGGIFEGARFEFGAIHLGTLANQVGPFAGDLVNSVRDMKCVSYYCLLNP